MSAELYFDSPLKKDAEPRPQFSTLVEIGEKIVKDYGDWLGSAHEWEDDVCMIKDTASHSPSIYPELDSGLMNGEWAGGLVGYIEHRGINPRIIHWGLTPATELETCKVIFYQDSGREDKDLAARLSMVAAKGGTVVSFLGTKMSQMAGLSFKASIESDKAGSSFYGQVADSISVPAPIFVLQDIPENCQSVLKFGDRMIAASCAVGEGRWFQVGAAVHAFYNSTGYGTLTDLQARRTLLDEFIGTTSTHLKIVESAPVVAYGRVGDGQRKWITVKNGQDHVSKVHLQIADLQNEETYVIKNLFTGEESSMKGQDLAAEGLPVELPGYWSTVYVVDHK